MMLRRHIISLLLAAASSLTPSWAQGPGSSGTYYRQADGKSGAQLKTALCGIIYNRTERTYNELWTDFRTTDARPNGKVWDMYSAISNFTFGTTNGETYMSANNFSKLGACTYPGYSGKVFEPADEYKGDFARTYFYMVTCYEEKLPTWYSNYSESRATLDGRTYPGLSQWQLQMLLSWAAQDPVSSKETQRNEAVWSIQHNRNPFIDYPGLEQYIWGDKKGIPFRYDGSHDNGIFTVTAEPQPSHPDGAVYDLQGRAINESASPTKGIYIRGGRKFVVR